MNKDDSQYVYSQTNLRMIVSDAEVLIMPTERHLPFICALVKMQRLRFKG